MLSYQLTSQQIAKCIRCAREVTDRRSKFSKGKGSTWHAGSFGTPDVSTRVGFFGEVALYEILSVWFKSIPSPKIEVTTAVQKYDFDWKTPVGSKHEVKTTVAAPDGDQNYVRVKAIPHADTFWFLSTSDPECGDVYLRGWVTKDELLERSVERKGRGNWVNRVIETENLNTANQFLEHRK
jgi:hypothetical protein